MRIMVLLFSFMLAGCAGDRLRAPTKCEAVSAVLSNPSTTRRQEAAAMEMGRNNHCFGNLPPQNFGGLTSPSRPRSAPALSGATVTAATAIEAMGKAGVGSLPLGTIVAGND